MYREQNYSFSIEHEHLQFIPYAKLPEMPQDTFGRMFLARYGMPLKFNVTLPQAKKGDALQENIYAICNLGLPGQSLPVISVAKGEDASQYAAIPELITPAAGEIIRGSNVDFCWSGPFSSSTLTVYSSQWETMLNRTTGDFSLEFDTSNLETGIYYWQVKAKQSNGCSVSSPIRSFTFLSREGNVKDSDDDGFSDNDEFMAGTNPEDSGETPLRFSQSFKSMLEVSCGQFFSFELKSEGGRGFARWNMCGTYPAWLELNPSGIISGVPEKNGTFEIEISVTSGNGQVLRRKVTLKVGTPKASQSRIGTGALGVDSE